MYVMFKQVQPTVKINIFFLSLSLDPNNSLTLLESNKSLYRETILDKYYTQGTCWERDCIFQFETYYIEDS